MVSCILIQAEKPLTLFSFFKANFVTLVATARSVLALLFRPGLAKARAQILKTWKGLALSMSRGRQVARTNNP